MSPPSPLRAGKVRWLYLSALVVALDQWSKWWVQDRLPLHVPHPVFPGLNLTHVENTGVAFGLFAADGRLPVTLTLTLLGLVALGVLGVYFARTPHQDRRLLAALALILGGAVGNLIDRVASGAVTDFVDVYVRSYHWHTFNVADSAITVGTLLIVWDVLRPHRGADPGDERAESPGDEAGEPA